VGLVYKKDKPYFFLEFLLRKFKYSFLIEIFEGHDANPNLRKIAMGATFW
jgi:hypothetical protein